MTGAKDSGSFSPTNDQKPGRNKAYIRTRDGLTEYRSLDDALRWFMTADDGYRITLEIGGWDVCLRRDTTPFNDLGTSQGEVSVDIRNVADYKKWLRRRKIQQFFGFNRPKVIRAGSAR